eukprot:g16216.t1
MPGRAQTHGGPCFSSSSSQGIRGISLPSHLGEKLFEADIQKACLKIFNENLARTSINHCIRVVSINTDELGCSSKKLRVDSRAKPGHAPRSGNRDDVQDCEAISWADLCERQLTSGECFQLQPGTSPAMRCQLRGPASAHAPLRPAQLRAAAQGPDATHPRNQGLLVLTLRGLWKHFESFILDRNMHFVVANIVRPLTQSKGVSFVTLWGGREVDYFVSHSWGTSFAHFVHSIRCHALSKEGPTFWMDAAYWICSFANNQWNIAAELADDPMDSAFARALRGGIKGVAMVLDRDVQPLTRALTAHCASTRAPSLQRLATCPDGTIYQMHKNCWRTVKRSAGPTFVNVSSLLVSAFSSSLALRPTASCADLRHHQHSCREPYILDGCSLLDLFLCQQPVEYCSRIGG